MKASHLLSIALLSVCSVAVQAQSLWTSAEFKAKLGKSFGTFAEVGYRTTDGMDDAQRIDASLGLDYKIVKPLKIAADYTYIHQHQEAGVTSRGNIIPSYWQPRHRFDFDVTGTLKLNRISLSLRERYQLTHRAEKSVAKYESDGVTRKDDELIEGKTTHILRSRLQADYDIKNCDFTPFVSVEVYNSLSDGFSYDKSRFTAGCEYKINRHNSLSLYYRYINRNDDDERSGHVIGVAYKFKL
jgi:opacity protein-like surface antigen